MSVAFFLEVGLLLVVLPWSAFWERNYFAVAWPPLEAFVTNNFVRGAVTGLGLVNLCAGFADLALVFASRPSGAARHHMVDRGETHELPLRDSSGPS